jgi:hypothetical protein
MKNAKLESSTNLNAFNTPWVLAMPRGVTKGRAA